MQPISAIVNGATILAGLSAVVLAGVVVRREMRADAVPAGVEREPVAVKGWDELIAGGHRIGPSDARVVVLEFGDYECPFCRTYDRRMQGVLRAYPRDVALVYRHYPLRNHRFAIPAAQAAECAASHDRFEPYHHLLYERQDSLGLLSFTTLAARVGVQDTAAFSRCLADEGIKARIDADIKAAKAIGVTGTPAVYMNGMLYPRRPDSAAIADLLGKLAHAPGSAGRDRDPASRR